MKYFLTWTKINSLDWTVRWKMRNKNHLAEIEPFHLLTFCPASNKSTMPSENLNLLTEITADD